MRLSCACREETEHSQQQNHSAPSPQVSSGELPSIRVFLTHRASPDVDAAIDAAEGEELPELKSYRFIADEEVDGCNVAELNVLGKTSASGQCP